jgi:hypothetical protein
VPIYFTLRHEKHFKKLPSTFASIFSSISPTAAADASELKPSASAGAAEASASDEKADPKDDKKKIDPLQNDWREFECHTWHLEPTVRLISWAGSQVKTVL